MTAAAAAAATEAGGDAVRWHRAMHGSADAYTHGSRPGISSVAGGVSAPRHRACTA